MQGVRKMCDRVVKFNREGCVAFEKICRVGMGTSGRLLETADTP
jgi:hypothetical protein